MAKRAGMPEISIVLPTKEEEAVFGVVPELRKMFGDRAEIIIVDKSGAGFKRRLAKLGLKVIDQKSESAGVENAIIDGMKSCRAGILATVDADGTHELRGLEEGLRIIKAGKADLVLGNRAGHMDPGAMGSYLKFGNLALSWIYDMFYHQGVHDVLTGMQVMRREVFEKVKGERGVGVQILFFQTEAARAGYRITEVPIQYHVRSIGESRLADSKFVYGWQTCWHILRRSPYLRSFEVLGTIGLAMVIAGLCLAGSGRDVAWLLVSLLGLAVARLGLMIRWTPP